MGKALRKRLRAVISWVVQHAPKRRKFVLRGFPSYEDNLVAVYQQLLARGFRHIVWITDEPQVRPPVAVDARTKFVKRGTWQDYVHSITARYLFITHGHFIDDIPKSQICVNLWHGVPYKVIGRLDGKPGRRDTMVVATSAMTQDIMARSFGVERSRVVVTGQARTDRLFVKDRALRRGQVLPELAPGTRLLLWLPTFRATTHAGGRADGIDAGNAFNCGGFDEEKFNHFLAAHDCVCFLKPHPMAIRGEQRSASHLKFIDENWLRDRGTTLYEFLGLMDGLVSDISSVIVDFMLLDRPILLLFEDIQAYESSRGFSFNPIREWLPAPVTTHFDSFMDEMAAFARGEDRHRERRHRLATLLLEHRDAGSTCRILDLALRTDPAEVREGA